MDSADPRGPDRWKEWRAVPQEPDHGKHGHSDERTIYEEGAGPPQVDYCSITIDGGDDMLRERLQDIAAVEGASPGYCTAAAGVAPGSLGRLGGVVGTNQEVGRREESGGCETSTGFGSSERSFGVRHATLGQCASCWEQGKGLTVY